MNKLRRWQIEPDRGYSLQLAADARLSSTDHTDDQVWELALGVRDEPTLVLQTRYGGRAGMVSLVPMWWHEDRPIYEAQAFARAPYITGFAPGYVRIQATITHQLALQADYWAIESHAIGIRFTLSNARVEPTDVRLDLIAQVAAAGRELPLALLPLDELHSALSLERVGNLSPIIMMQEAAGESGGGGSPKLTRAFTVPGRKKIVIQVVHAGLPDVRASLALAQSWVGQGWNKPLQRMEEAAQALPVIETGDVAQEAAIAFSAQQIVQAFLRPSPSHPHPILVSARQPGRGFSAGQERPGSSQTPPLAYLTALNVAAIHPDFAHGIVRSYLASQQPDGWIDWRPGQGGARSSTLCLPVLARLAWGIFQYTEDAAFLAETFPGLLRFFDRWLQPDRDADGDGLPEWQSEAQTGYPFMPTFASWQPWGQKADIRLVEAPDLLAYLLSEAKSLREIAYFLRDSEAERRLEHQIERLQPCLERLWDAEASRYRYQDRDTHLAQAGRALVAAARGDEELLLAEPLNPPSRIVVEVSGGVDLTPRMKLQIQGLGRQGQAVQEIVDSSAFIWAHSRGAYTSRQVFSQIDRVMLEGLSRAYRVDVRTPDLTRLDLSALLPLWPAAVTPERAQRLIQLLVDPAHFWRSTGVTMCSAQDPQFDPAGASGAGGVWPFWQVLLGEGLIEHEALPQATELMKRLLAAQTAALAARRAFSEFYHSDLPQGLGEAGQVGGVVPLHLLLRVLGVRIISARKVWTGGPFAWGAPVKIQQHGVTVSRTPDSTQVEFPSGHHVNLANDTWQEIVDARLA